MSFKEKDKISIGVRRGVLGRESVPRPSLSIKNHSMVENIRAIMNNQFYSSHNSNFM